MMIYFVNNGTTGSAGSRMGQYVERGSVQHGQAARAAGMG